MPLYPHIDGQGQPHEIGPCPLADSIVVFFDNLAKFES
jgi:hypothetical protein